LDDTSEASRMQTRIQRSRALAPASIRSKIKDKDRST
jgi:hypothetical protein